LESTLINKKCKNKMIKKRIKEVIHYFLAFDENLPLEHRLFLSVVIIGIFISLLTSIVSIFISSPIIVLIITLFSFFSLVILYYLARVKKIFKPFITPLIITSFIAIAILWIIDGGINGSNLFVGFVILILGLIIVPVKNKKYIFALFITLIIIIYLIQFYRPDLISDFTSETTRWIDSLITAIYSSYFLFLIIRFLHKNYTDEKHRAEESEKKFRSITENSADAIFITDQQGKYIYTNMAVSVMLGYSLEEMRNKTIADLSPPDKTEEYFEILKRILTEGKFFTELEFLRKDGTYITTDLNAILLPEGFVYGSCRDFTVRKQIELALKEDEKKLLKINADKNRFISILSHDLINPFNNLLGLSEALREDIRKLDNDEIELYANRINKTARNIFNLLESILVWGRTEQGKIPFKPQLLSFSDICLNILEILNPVADEKGIKINYSAQSGTNVFADADMLKTVLRNLVSNAIKFTNRNGTIYINAEGNSENMTISVSDNGIGIMPDNLSKLFDISQVLTTKGTAEETGTGLGLLICKGFVEIHGGKIWVESESGKGSDFKVTLPFL